MGTAPATTGQHGNKTAVIDKLLTEAREHIVDSSVSQAAAALRAGSLVVDLRPMEFRWRHGDVPGAIAISRHVLEWRLDVTSPHRLKEIAAGYHDQEIVLLCSAGDSSCLAAHQVSNALRVANVHNVSGGFAAWCAAGLPVLRRLPTGGADLDD